MLNFEAVNRWLIAAFGIASGIYKVFGGQADIELFAHVGLTPLAVALFGALQAASAMAMVAAASRRAGAVVLALCNTFATCALFVAGVQPFGAISIVFVVMAAADASRPRRVSTKVAA